MSKLKFRTGTSDVVVQSANDFAKALAAAANPKARNYSSFGARKVEDSPAGPILEFIAVSEGIKRDQSTIRVKGIDLKGLRANPVFQWSHDYSKPPIGRIVDFRKTTVEGLGKVLKIRVAPLRSQMETEHKKFADSVWDMYLQGDLRAVSFGWRTIKATPIKDDEGYFRGWDFEEIDGLETSGVAVPADSDALITAIRERGLNPDHFVANRSQSGAIYEVREVLPGEFKAGEWSIVESPEDETVEVESENEQRKADEPEARSVDKQEATKDETVMDLEKLVATLGERFSALEKRIDEIPVGENRKGAVLNTANRKALTDAMQLIAAVLRNAGPQEADGDADTGKKSAAPEVTRTVEEPVVTDPPVDIKYEDIADIRKAMSERQAALRERSLAKDILGELVIRAGKSARAK